MSLSSPCNTCAYSDCTQYRKCSAYLKYVRTIWKQFNGYPARVYRAQKNMTRKKFIYEHPDIIRRYLEKGPCEMCRQAKDCKTPCAAYWRWWDARREWHRRRFGL